MMRVAVAGAHRLGRRRYAFQGGSLVNTGQKLLILIALDELGKVVAQKGLLK
jgi:hypothetical protein